MILYEIDFTFYDWEISLERSWTFVLPFIEALRVYLQYEFGLPAPVPGSVETI